MAADPLVEMFGLQGRRALVTGGSKGIGLSIARALATAGAQVRITCRSEEEGRAALETIGARTAHSPRLVVCDHARAEESAEALAGQIEAVDVLVNNAGTGHVAALERFEPRAWAAQVDVTLTTPLALVRAFAPGMKERGWGRIVNVASVLGVVARAERSLYCTAKSGMIGMTRALAVELAPFGVTVNAVSPGQVRTPLTEGMWNRPADNQAVTSRIPMGRWGTVEEIAHAVWMLTAPGSAYVTGQNVVVDGGWSAW